MNLSSLLALTAPGVAGLQPYQPGKPIETLEREYGVSNAIKLASNENPLGPGPLAMTALTKALQGLARYPDGAAFALKAALGQHLNVVPNQLTLGNGSSEILELAARAFLTPANEIIFSEYAFALYPIITQSLGAKARVAKAKDYGHDLQAMAALINANTRLIFIANPNNPTGSYLTQAELTAFLDQVPEHVLVLLDEAYFEFVYAADYPNGVALLPRYPNVLVMRTFSKVYGLAGLRVGYGVAHPDLISLLERVRQPFNINGAALVAAEAALGDQEHLARSVACNREGLQQLMAGVRACGLQYLPSVGNFLSVDFARDAAPINEALLRQGVIVRPVAAYNMPTFLRVSVGLSEENTRFLRALKASI